jgi:Na+/alanine symporter
MYLFCWLVHSVCVNARILLCYHLASRDIFIICIIVVIVILHSSTVETASLKIKRHLTEQETEFVCPSLHKHAVNICMIGLFAFTCLPKDRINGGKANERRVEYLKFFN